jgi:hypothetical protein
MYILVWVVKVTVLPPYHREKHIFTRDTVGWIGAGAVTTEEVKRKAYNSLGLEPRTFRSVA